MVISWMNIEDYGMRKILIVWLQTLSTISIALFNLDTQWMTAIQDNETLQVPNRLTGPSTGLALGNNGSNQYICTSTMISYLIVHAFVPEKSLLYKDESKF